MLVLRQTIRHISALVPDQWKRHLKTALLEEPDTEASLRRMQQLAFNPVVVIDVGAYIGEWTSCFKRIFPSARVLMVLPTCANPQVQCTLNPQDRPSKGLFLLP
jgi:hypothetical protein